MHGPGHHRHTDDAATDGGRHQGEERHEVAVPDTDGYVGGNVDTEHQLLGTGG